MDLTGWLVTVFVGGPILWVGTCLFLLCAATFGMPGAQYLDGHSLTKSTTYVTIVLFILVIGWTAFTGGM